MRVVIVGNGLMLSNMIIGAIDAGVTIVGVLRYEAVVRNRFDLFLKDLFNPSYEYTLIKQMNLKSLNFKSVNTDEFRHFLVKNNVDVVLVGTFKERISKSTFDIPTIGTINVHPSLLPKYRGPNPYMQTIMHGEEYSGVTLHLVDEGYDTGAVLLQEKVKINPDDTSKELRERTVVVARSLVTKFFSELNNNIITPIKQSERNATYYKNISGDEKMLDFNNQTSVEICRTVKALHPFLPTYITYNNKFFVVNPYKVEILDKDYDSESNTVVDKSSKHKSLTIICKDKKAVKFEGLKLYGCSYLTKYYIKHRVKLK